MDPHTSTKSPPAPSSTLSAIPLGVSPAAAAAAASGIIMPCRQQVIAAESFRDYTRFRQSILTQLSRRPPSEAEGSGEASESEVPLQERRKKNNEAAKRSRDSRRAKEDEIAIRAAFLEQENLQLKWEAARLRTEIGHLRASLLLMTRLTDTSK